MIAEYLSAAAMCFLIVSGLIGAYGLVSMPNLADRIIALDLALISFMGAIAIDGARRGSTTYFILLAVIAIIGFTATVAATRLIEGDDLIEPKDN